MEKNTAKLQAGVEIVLITFVDGRSARKKKWEKRRGETARIPPREAEGRVGELPTILR